MASAPAPVIEICRIRDAAEAAALFATLAEARTERCGFAYLDPEWRLLGTRETASGHVDGVRAPIRDVVRDVLDLDATAVVMVHNHPAGDPTPSAADRAVTRRLLAALEALDVRLIDHIVLAGPRRASMRGMGLL